MQFTLKDAVEREGMVDTGDLAGSIRAVAVTKGKGWISGHVSYSELLRIKDMKVPNYGSVPPIRPIADWVERTGVSRFAYIPGYKKMGRRPTSKRLTASLAAFSTTCALRRTYAAGTGGLQRPAQTIFDPRFLRRHADGGQCLRRPNVP